MLSLKVILFAVSMRKNQSKFENTAFWVVVSQKTDRFFMHCKKDDSYLLTLSLKNDKWGPFIKLVQLFEKKFNFALKNEIRRMTWELFLNSQIYPFLESGAAEWIETSKVSRTVFEWVPTKVKVEFYSCAPTNLWELPTSSLYPMYA